MQKERRDWTFFFFLFLKRWFEEWKNFWTRTVSHRSSLTFSRAHYWLHPHYLHHADSQRSHQSCVMSYSWPHTNREISEWKSWTYYMNLKPDRQYGSGPYFFFLPVANWGTTAKIFHGCVLACPDWLHSDLKLNPLRVELQWNEWVTVLDSFFLRRHFWYTIAPPTDPLMAPFGLVSFGAALLGTPRPGSLAFVSYCWLECKYNFRTHRAQRLLPTSVNTAAALRSQTWEAESQLFKFPLAAERL